MRLALALGAMLGMTACSETSNDLDDLGIDDPDAGRPTVQVPIRIEMETAWNVDEQTPHRAPPPGAGSGNIGSGTSTVSDGWTDGYSDVTGVDEVRIVTFRRRDTSDAGSTAEPFLYDARNSMTVPILGEHNGKTDGYTTFSNAFTRPLVRPVDNSDYKFGRATHGHHPDKGAQPTLIAFGPHIKAGAHLAMSRDLPAMPLSQRLAVVGGDQFFLCQLGMLVHILKSSRHRDCCIMQIIFQLSALAEIIIVLPIRNLMCFEIACNAVRLQASRNCLSLFWMPWLKDPIRSSQEPHCG